VVDPVTAVFEGIAQEKATGRDAATTAPRRRQRRMCSALEKLAVAAPDGLR
jgi:hypothetical protein